MSGGSFNYLFTKDAHELLDGGYDEELQRMADELARLGYAPDAASETLEVLLEIRAARIRIDTRLARLQPLWRSVEWWRSNDGGEDGVIKALATFRGEDTSDAT